MIAYVVTARFDDRQTAEQWVAWLKHEHVAQVCAAGALDAEVINFDLASGEAGARCEVRYHFASREAYAQYERDHAPRLRALGLERFPPQRGIKYGRRLGEVRFACSTASHR